MASTNETVLSVTGMSCAACVRHVEGALKKLAGVSSVAVSLEQGRVVVEHEAGRPSLDAMLEAIREEGYEGAAAA